MSQRVSRGERILENLVKNPRSTLSENGKTAIIVACDPFHDDQIKGMQGWPDAETAPSVVRCIKSAIAVTARSGGGAALTDPWDMHITLWPFLNPQLFIEADDRRNNILNASSTSLAGDSGYVGGLQVQRVTTVGGDVDYFGIPGGTDHLGLVTLDPSFQQGVHRVVGIGYEVHDITAELYRQGDVTVYQQTQMPRDPGGFTVINTHNFAPSVVDASMEFTGTMFRHPPKNTAQAILMPGAKTWPAAKGVYQVGHFHSAENPSYATDYNVPVIYDSPYAYDAINASQEEPNETPLHVGGCNGSDDTNLVLGAATLIRRRYIAAPQHIYPYHNCGAIFSGLNPLASFKIVMNVYVETFPGIDESSLLPLATPSCSYDPMALEVISHCMGTLPIAVPVGENPLGEWFASAVQSAADFLSPMLIGSGNPYAMAAGGALKVAGEIAHNYGPKPTTPKRKKDKK